MNEISIESIQKALRKKVPRLAGADGEEYAKRWLETTDWEIEEVDQSRESMPQEYRDYGAKRCDFTADPNDGIGILLIDAKYHSTNGLTVFRLQDAELQKYRNLVRYYDKKWPNRRHDLVFMLIPKEGNGDLFLWVHIDQFNNGQEDLLDGKPATRITLDANDDLWCEIN